MKGGGASVPPSRFRNPISGLIAGLVPPTDGCAWQPPQLSRFIRGPSPSATRSDSAKSVWPAEKYSSWFADRPSRDAPAPAVPGRTPGSTALIVDETIPICAAIKRAAAADTRSDVEDRDVFILGPSV